MLALALSFVSIAAQQSDPAAPAPAAPETAGAQPAGQSDPDAEPGQTPTFRSRIDAVTLDVIVTDRQGRPVLDLEPADFEIIENGTPQTIQNFELVQVDTSQPESSFVRDITSIDQQQRETAQPDTRVLVIFLDDYHVRIENSLRIRQDLARFVTQLTARDLVALMYPLTPVNGITFSRNHEATADAIMAFQGRKYNYIPVNAYEQRYANYPPEALEMLRNQIVTSALRGLATYLGTLREGKKQVRHPAGRHEDGRPDLRRLARRSVAQPALLFADGGARRPAARLQRRGPQQHVDLHARPARARRLRCAAR
jgi:VWFA-related protein